MIRRLLANALATAALSTIAVGTLGAMAVPGQAAVQGAKTVKACKLLKASEISQAFGGATVAPGETGTSTVLSNECNFDVSASGDVPSGTVTVHVMSPRGKIAFKAHEKGTFGFQTVAGEKGVLYWDKTGSSEMLKGDTLVGVQGVFIGDTLPIQQHDAQAEVIALNKIAVKRA
jgi:hypothetical protein